MWPELISWCLFKADEPDQVLAFMLSTALLLPCMAQYSAQRSTENVLQSSPAKQDFWSSEIYYCSLTTLGEKFAIFYFSPMRVISSTFSPITYLESMSKIIPLTNRKFQGQERGSCQSAEATTLLSRENLCSSSFMTTLKVPKLGLDE